MFLDFVFILVLAISVFFGYKKGFSQMLISCLVFIFSLVLVVCIYNYLGDVFFGSEYGSALLQKVAEGISQKLDSFSQSVFNNIPFIGTLLGEGSSQLADTDAVSLTLAQKSLKVLLAIPLAVIAYILLKILIFFVRRVVKFTTNLPVLGFVDSLLGSCCGFLTGIIIVAVLYFVLGYVQLIPSMEFLRQQFDSSFLVVLINDFFN